MACYQTPPSLLFNLSDVSDFLRKKKNHIFAIFFTGRPKRAKTRASKKTAAIHIADPSTVNEGIEEFFRPASTTPSTLTPLVSPTSEDCSLLSFADSPTLSRGDGSRFSNVTSEETTPILEERRIIKLERSSPVMKNVNWSSRSRSSDNLEKVSPSINEKSPPTSNYIENAKEMPDAYPATINSKDMGKHKSPSNESVKSQHSELQRPGNDIIKTPVPAQKPRPWSVLGHESKNDFETNDATAMTPDDINDGMDLVLISGQTPGGSIVGITPGAIGGGSIVGITPGKRSILKSEQNSYLEFVTFGQVYLFWILAAITKSITYLLI